MSDCCKLRDAILQMMEGFTVEQRLSALGCAAGMTIHDHVGDDEQELNQWSLSFQICVANKIVELLDAKE